MRTTHEKVGALVGGLSSIEPSELAPELRDLVTNYQMLQGVAGMVGVDLPANPLALVLPDDPTDADQMIDSVLALLHALRGDDLPPFDPNRYGEGTIALLVDSIRTGGPA